MRPIDTIFIILVLSSYLKNSKQKYLVSVLPILAFVVSSLQGYVPVSIEPFVLPIIAILVCLISIELAPISLLLLFPDYNHLWEALMIPFFWFLITPLMQSINTRIDNDYLPSYLLGFPIRMISLGILYFIFYPLLYL